jgi:hypothetical protein
VNRERFAFVGVISINCLILIIIHKIVPCSLFLYKILRCLLIDVVMSVFQVQSIFDLIQQKRVQCTAITSEQGVCVSRKDCTDLVGSASGNCARNWGVCCVSAYAFFFKCVIA